MLPENCSNCGSHLTPECRTSAEGTNRFYCFGCGAEIFPGLLPKNCASCGRVFRPVPRRKVDGAWGLYCAECDTEVEPKKIGPFKIAEYIGGGEFSRVYLGLLDYSSAPVAIKLLSTFYVSDDEANRRFRREAYALKQLRHENICTVVDFGREGDTPFVWMEYVEGETLREAINRMDERELSISYWMDIVVQIAEGLSALHKRGVIHRDLKPENIKIKPHPDKPDQSVVKILDFGLARIEIPFNQVLNSTAPTWIQPTTLSREIGTPAYMSPEQIRAEARLGEASDIFSFGVILYEIFSGGKRPFDRATRDATIAAIVSEPPELLRKLNPAVPRKLESIVLKALQKKMNDRYKTEFVLRALKSFQLSLTRARMLEMPNAWRLCFEYIDSISLMRARMLEMPNAPFTLLSAVIFAFSTLCFLFWTLGNTALIHPIYALTGMIGGLGILIEIAVGTREHQNEVTDFIDSLLSRVPDASDAAQFLLETAGIWKGDALKFTVVKK